MSPLSEGARPRLRFVPQRSVEAHRSLGWSAAVKVLVCSCLCLGMVGVEAQAGWPPKPILNTPLDPTVPPRQIFQALKQHADSHQSVSQPSSQPAALQRIQWSYDGGYFQATGNGNWVQCNANGQIAFRFREVGRSDDWVQLMDDSRNIGALLRADRCELAAPGVDWYLHKYGSWSR